MKRFWQKVCWKCTDLKKIKNIIVNFELYTDSGYNIMVTKAEFLVEELIPLCNDWQERGEKEKEILEKNRKRFNKMAKDILIEYQKKKIKNLKVGKCYSGKFIVKCVWELDLELEPMTFEEYQQASEILKEKAKQEKEWKKCQKQKKKLN
jgi:hypothetical protein